MNAPEPSPAVPDVIDCGDAVCIIGAGPGGLSIARALKQHGIRYEQFERFRDVGGIWDLENPGTPMYHSAHFISSRATSGFYGFPMPDAYPDYPSNRQILAYTRSFARAFDLYPAIRFGTAVEQATPVGDRWQVRLSTGETREYRALVCATGTNWHPRMPQHPGHFNGEIRHSVTYTHADEFRGKRVLIVGLGNSGADIACDAAANADAAFVSVRRGYHFIPKHILGIPVDEFAEKGPTLPLWLERPIFGLLLRLTVGDVSRLGLPKPDHRLFESHPLLNAQLLHYLQHGDIHAKPDVASFDGDEVVFKDGSRERVDLVLYATGYDMRMPYLPDDAFAWAGGRPDLYMRAFSRRHRNLFGLGYLETNSSAYTLFDHISQMVAAYLHDQTHRPEQAREFDTLIRDDQPDLTRGIRFVASDRTQGYIEIHAYKKYLETLRRRMGWAGLQPGCFDAIRVSAPEAVS